MDRSSPVAPAALLHLLDQLMAEATRDPRLLPEIQRARREFFGAMPAERQPPEQAAAAARFAEWVLLERDSDVLGEPPARALARPLDPVPEGLGWLLDSTVGVFVVEACGDDLRVRDLQDDRLLDVEPLGGLDLGAGDVLVGRLYGTGQPSLVGSAALAVQRAGQGLAAAFCRDLEGLAPKRRLTQAELEHLLFRRFAAAEAARRARAPLEHLEARLEQILEEAGAELSAAAISQALAAAAEPGPVLGPLLDELAFGTRADLDRLRVLLLEIWNAHHADAAAPATAAPPAREQHPEADSPGLGARLAQRIERGLAAHEDLEALFGDVDAMLGDEEALDDEEDPGASEDPEPGQTSGEARGRFDTGDLAPLVEEFLWEEGCGGGAERAVLALLVAQQRESPVPRVDLEYLEPNDLLRLLLRHYLEAAPKDRAAAVQRVWAVLERFYAWAERTQDYRLHDKLAACRAAFVDQLERIDRAGVALSTEQRPSGRPTLLRVVETSREGCAVAAVGEGEPVAIASPLAASYLRPGDLLLGTLRHTRAGMGALVGFIVVLPAAAEGLLG